ncbi:MAG: hypothetical protein OHK0028_10010 [Deltaproteobacteria bacterium]
MGRKKTTIIIPLPKVKERGVMPKPTRVIPDPKKEEGRRACRRKVTPAEGEKGGTR